MPARGQVLMLTWEYPPKIVGGISRVAQELSEALVKQGWSVIVVTASHPGAPEQESVNGVEVTRVDPGGDDSDFVAWVKRLNSAMEKAADEILFGIDAATPVVLHAHDWLTHACAVALKEKHKLPLISTVHATEHGRHGGIYGETSRYIHEIERKLVYDSWRVIVCTEFMKEQVAATLGAPADKMDVIPNGVNAEKFEFAFSDEERRAFRARFAAPDEKIVFFVGRMVPEKGAHLLIDAMMTVRALQKNARLVIAGGGYRDHLVGFSRFIRMGRDVTFTGFIPDSDLLKLYRSIDCAVYPSLYEPFGIVALEAMAAKAPVVVSDIGGFREIVRHEINGIQTYAGNSESIAWGILRCLQDPESAQGRVEKAYKDATEIFNWERIASATGSVYDRVWSEYLASGWGQGN